MTWDAVFKAVILIISSLGGGSAIILAVTKWGSDILATKIKSDIDNKHEQEMALYKQQLADSTAKLDALIQNTSYISRQQYDLEMNIYRETWKSLFSLMQGIEWAEDLKKMNPQVMSNPDEVKDTRKERYDKFVELQNSFKKAVDENAPFYRKEAFLIMNKIIVECKKIEEIFAKYSDEVRLADMGDQQKLNTSCSNIKGYNDKLIEEVRNYLQSLKFIP